MKERIGTYVTTLLLVFVRTRHTRFGNFVEKDETTSSEVWGRPNIATTRVFSLGLKFIPVWKKVTIKNLLLDLTILDGE